MRDDPAHPPLKDAASNLLFGLLALQNSFISRDALVAAFGTWIADKSKPLDQILLDQGHLDNDCHTLLMGLVRQHFKLHGDDPERSLADLSAMDSALRRLLDLSDPDLCNSLAHVAATRPSGQRSDPDATATFLGTPTSSGGRFRVLRLHAEGGLGRVYEARDDELGRKVAVKELRPDKADDADLRARFVLEAEISGGLQHPGIVPVYSLGHRDDGQPFYAMRFVEGQSLREAVAAYHEAHPRPDPNTVGFRTLLQRFLDVSNAIAFAHSRGVLHRDLKPHNVMIGDYGEALIIDWGLAKATGRRDPDSGAREEATLVPPSGSNVAATQGIIGTPGYMSPEQAAGHTNKLGPATDVYGLGAILYHFMTCQAPVTGSDFLEVLDRVRRGAIARPRSLNSNISRSLEAVCLKALALRPEDRYPRAPDLTEDLNHWLADEPVSVYRDSLLTSAVRWMRKHRVATAAAAATLVVTLAASLLAYRSERAHTTELSIQRGEFWNLQDVCSSELKENARNVADDPILKSNPQMEVFREQWLQRLRYDLNYYRERLKYSRQSMGRGFYLGTTSPRFLEQLASISFEIGRMSDEIGDREEALTNYREALSIQQKLAIDHPKNSLYASELAATLYNVARLDIDAWRFDEARERIQEASSWQKKYLADNPEDESRRNLAKSYLTNLIKAARGLGRDDVAAAARREVEELNTTDPRVGPFQARLTAVLKGEPPRDNSERLALAQRAYDTNLYAAAARLWAEALAADRQAQHCYNAACAAVLAADGRGIDDPPPDEAARTKLRRQAFDWLRAELATWAALVAQGPPQVRATVAKTLMHWLRDPDLASVRDAAALSGLPDDERQVWQSLWADVAGLIYRPAASTPGRRSPDLPAAVFTQPRTPGEQGR
jgi:serine/threonine-protein kinase